MNQNEENVSTWKSYKYIFNLTLRALREAPFPVSFSSTWGFLVMTWTSLFTDCFLSMISLFNFCSRLLRHSSQDSRSSSKRWWISRKKTFEEKWEFSRSQITDKLIAEFTIFSFPIFESIISWTKRFKIKSGVSLAVLSIFNTKELNPHRRRARKFRNWIKKYFLCI